MSSTLDIDKIVKEVVKKLYQRFGIKALFVIDQPPQPEAFNQYFRRFNIPWLSINLLLLRDLTAAQRRMIEESGILINEIYTTDTVVVQNLMSDNSFLILSDLSVEESDRYEKLSFNGLKDRLVFEALKLGKEIYCFSNDLTGCADGKPKFLELLHNRIGTLKSMGIKLIEEEVTYDCLEGVCDLQTLKRYEGKTVIIAEGSIISPLAQDYIKTGAVTVIRK